MRAAPIGLALADPIAAYQLGRDQAYLTHGSPLAAVPAGILASTVSQLVNEVPLPLAIYLASGIASSVDPADAEETVNLLERASALAETNPTPTPDLINSLGLGFIGHEALALSTYIALTHNPTTPLEVTLALAVNHSGDSDSTGSITGQILGALLGPPALPISWVDYLDESDPGICTTLSIAASLLAKVRLTSPRRTTT